MSFEVAAAGAAGRDAASEQDRLRHLTDAVAAQLVASGLPRACVPSEVGGTEAPIADVVDAVVRLAADDGATAWCGMIAATTSLVSGYLAPDWLEPIYGDPASVTGGFAAPVGRATEVEGGLSVTGQWQWGSGTHHCTWIGGGALLADADGAPVRRPDGLVAPFVFFERQQVELLDTWHTAGLRGTGSTDYRVEDTFVPEGRWVQVGGEPVIDRPLYRFSFFGALACGVAAVTIGLARRAIDDLADLAADKRPQGSSKPLAERPVVQAEVARAEGAVRSARALLDLAIADATADAVAGRVDAGHRVGLRLAATDATTRCVEAVDRCYHSAGGAAVYESSPLSRVFRDVHVAIQHAMVAPRIYEVVGRHALGLDTDLRQI
ncbi:MAG TPA: acyl-CoA dehydrogenase family protein [Acidimicrobiales bacterium]|nr:acyl-CoA dehydrogenase family protein [Acidimicrobiales bacterium]